MAELIRSLARRVFLSDPAQGINQVVEQISQKRALQRWEKSGRQLPPPHIVKQRTVMEYAARFSVHTFIETGTYLGSMVNATKDTFARIISIELDPALYERARKRFSAFSHITILQGDSSQILGQILASIQEPCLFWLDAHHSGMLTARGSLESPIVQEMDHILNHPIVGHVVLIDDARIFVGQGGYPTLTELQSMVASRRSDWIFQIKDDIIRAHNRRSE